MKYGGGGAGGTAPSDGTYYLTQNGTPDKPIVIKAAGDGEAIFDGDGNFNLFNVMAANYNYFEGLTIRNTDLAFLAGLKKIAGSSGITIKKCRIENVGRAFLSDWSGSKDFYIADNVITGRFAADHLMGFTGRTWQKYGDPPKLVSEYAVKVYGSGHVVAYNAISSFHDGVDVLPTGIPMGLPTRFAIACPSPSISTTTRSRMWKTTASNRTAAPTTSASCAIAASIMAIAR